MQLCVRVHSCAGVVCCRYDAFLGRDAILEYNELLLSDIAASLVPTPCDPEAAGEDRRHDGGDGPGGSANSTGTAASGDAPAGAGAGDGGVGGAAGADDAGGGAGPQAAHHRPRPSKRARMGDARSEAPE